MELEFKALIFYMSYSPLLPIGVEQCLLEPKMKAVSIGVETQGLLELKAWNPYFMVGHSIGIAVQGLPTISLFIPLFLFCKEFL